MRGWGSGWVRMKSGNVDRASIFGCLDGLELRCLYLLRYRTI